VAQRSGAKGSTKFIYDGQDVLLDDSDGTQTKYLNGPGIDDKLRMQAGSSVGYYLADHLGSTNGLTDGSGSLTASNFYDSFGNGTNPSFPSRYQYTGREFDPVTGLQYNRARWYDPSIGRFISEDPIGFGGGDVNVYNYVKGNAINRTDPLGLYDTYDPEVIRRAVEAGRDAAPAIGVGSGAVGAAAYAALPYVAVAAGGFAVGYAIGYYPGQWTARYFYPDQFPDSQVAPQSTPRPGQEPTCSWDPWSKPFYRFRPAPNPLVNRDRDDEDDDDSGCTREWAQATRVCGERAKDPNFRGVLGNSASLRKCAAGLVSQRCGGNLVK
jgi:RHS repeat-associated protein